MVSHVVKQCTYNIYGDNMANKCVYGDVESSQVVPCQYDPQTGSIKCPQPHRRAGYSERLEHIEMDVKFVNKDGEESRATLIATHSEATRDVQPVTDVQLADNGVQETPEQPQEVQQKWKKVVIRFAKFLSTILADVTGEFIGTFMITFVICSVVASAVITSQLGVWPVAVVCGLVVALSVYCTKYISDAHLNPAVTLAFAIVRRKVFSWQRIVPYIVAQILGGFWGGAVMYAFYRHAIYQFEENHNIERGRNGSELSAMIFGEYFPNPAIYSHSVGENLDLISPVEAVLVEGWATGIFVFVIFSLTSDQNSSVGSGKHKVAVPMLIGITVVLLVSIYAPLTQASFNPARDFGPRLFALCAGWGGIAIPGPRNGFWVYIVGPAFGGPIGAALCDCLVARVVRFAMAMKKKSKLTT